MDKFSVKNDRRMYFRIDLDTPLCTRNKCRYADT